jgi:hypothetical protein
VMATITTALLAVVVFVLTQSFLKLVLEPVQDQRELVGEVAPALLFYANVVAEFDVPEDIAGGRGMKIGMEREEVEETRKALRGLAGRLRASLWTIPFYDTLARMGWVRSKQDVIEASTQLVGWSNSLSRDDYRDKRLKIIADRLGITEKLEASGGPRTGPE